MRFGRYIGIDYSGAKTPDSTLPGIRVYAAHGNHMPKEVRLVRNSSRHWTRRGLATWLLETLSEGPPTLVGMDFAFSFPLAFFIRYRMPRDWSKFLDDFCRHWPTDHGHVAVNDVREGRVGRGRWRCGSAHWRRLTDRAARGAKSPFHFDVPGSVAHSTHAGLPWLRHIRHTLKSAVWFWPFDGWHPPRQRHVIVEVYPALWRHMYPAGRKTPDQQDAYSACRWLQKADQTGSLETFWDPLLVPEQRAFARVEGWILGVSPPRL